ncbi:MAG TPA: hypothetical protein VNZ26_18715 [Vicinamibacterales bacterium]|nr:hypothetical protein [Vicinamibacterales bacterium]
MFIGHRRWVMAASLGIATSWAVAARAQRPQATLPLDPPRDRGTSITPAYEGWYPNPDGSFSMLIGYYNRNVKEALDIPVGPNNRIEPGAPDQGQPTHFEVGRQWGVFVVRVPKDFGTKAVTWTIVSNGETQSVPFTLNKRYPISPFKELGMGNQPPILAFSQGGAKVTGPPTGVSATLTGTVNQPVTISVWVEDPKAPGEAEAAPPGFGLAPGSIATVSLHEFRGPGKVTFDKVHIPVKKQGDMITSTATFAAPGEYLVRVQANDESGEGGFGFQCCWTNTYVRVTVR